MKGRGNKQPTTEKELNASLMGGGTMEHLSRGSRSDTANGCPDGSVYRGAFVAGRAEGRGALTTQHGDLLEGTWSDGRLVDQHLTDITGYTSTSSDTTAAGVDASGAAAAAVTATYQVAQRGKEKKLHCAEE